jgi:hypothetical protein
MYAYPTYLPEFSNREDLLLSVALFDDDTGDPLDLVGITKQNPGDYVNNMWAVIVGPYVSISHTPITIPDFPVGDELQALALTVDPGLPWLAGDPVQIANLAGGIEATGPFGPPPYPYVDATAATYYVTEDSPSLPPVPPTLNPGPNTLTGYITSYDPNTGNMIVQIGPSFQFEIRDLRTRHDFDYAYTSSWDWTGSFNDYGMILSASLGNGVLITGPGALQIRFPEATFRKLSHRTYGAGLTMTDSVDTRQIFIARLPLQFGGVSL